MSRQPSGRQDRAYQLREVSAQRDGDLYTRMRILAVPYNEWTNLGYGLMERIAAHAPDKSVREAARGLPLLLFHDNRSLPIGSCREWTLDDPKALYGDYDIDSDPVAQRAARSVDAGHMNGASIGFAPIRETAVWNDEDGWDDSISRSDAYVQVTHTEIRLLEVSLTPTPAYAGAQVESVRSFMRSLRQGQPEREPLAMDARTRVAIDGFREFAAARRTG